MPFKKTENGIKGEIIDPLLKNETAFYDSNDKPELTSCKMAKLPIIIFIPGSEIALRVQNVQFYIVDTQMT